MHHDELRRMEHRPRGIARAVQPVAEERMPDRCHVHADLVRAPGAQLECDKRTARPGLAKFRA